MIGSNYTNKVRVGEHIITVPDLPTDKSKILFVDEKDAYWRRDLLVTQYRQIWWDFIPYFTKIYQDATLYDQDGVLVSLNKEDSDYIQRTYQEEMRRREYGVHFKNGNDIVYIPGDLWFVLMYCKTKRPDKKGDYFDFRMFQRDDALLCWYGEHNEKVGGVIISKPKKTGITNLRWLYLLNKSTRSKNRNYGSMNIDQDKCAKTFRDHFMYSYNGLPPVWKAQIKSKSETEGKIVFGKQYSNSKKNRHLNDSEDELNTTVMCVPTMSHAFDVDVFDINWYDEFPKYKQDFGEIYRSNNSGTSIQDFMVGKIWMTSYTPDESGPSFFAGKELYFDSKLRTISDKSNGQTKSKLICHHIPAYQSWSTSFDKYGVCNEVDAYKRIQFARDQFKDRPRELQAEVRKYANDEKEAWSTGGSGSVFDNVRLADLLTNVEEEARTSPEPLYREGRLEWKNKLWEAGMKNRRPAGAFCDVEFVPLSEREIAAGERGRIRIYNEIPKTLQNAVLRNGKDEWGCLIPPKEFKYTFGADPTAHAAASEVIEGSKNAFMVKSRRDDRLDSMFKCVSSNRFDIVYFDRPELPNEAYEDLIKLIIYAGAIGICEANVPTMATKIIEEGLGGFILVKNEEGVMVQWQRHMGLANEADKTYQHIRTTSNNAESKWMLEQFVSLYKNYIQKPEDGDKDYGATIKDERLLNQLLNIQLDKPGATRLFDLFMAGGYALVADEIYTAILSQDLLGDYTISNISAVLTALQA